MKKSSLILGLVFVLSLMSFGAIPPVVDDWVTNTDETATTTHIPNVIDTVFEDVEIVEFEYDVNTCEDCVPEETREFFRKKIKFPSNAKNLTNGIVVVKFMYDNDGSIRVVDSSFSDKRLKDYVLLQLKKHKLGQSIVEPGKFYFARFDFIIQ